MLAGLGNWTLVMLAVLQHVCGIRRSYKVNYAQPNVCAVQNSTVIIPCTFFYPSSVTVTRVMWGHERNDLFSGPFLFDSNDTSLSRFQYHGDKKNNCSFSIQRVRKEDSGKYAFRFLTTVPGGKYTGVDGSTLQVEDLRASAPGTIKEGESVRLTCTSNCTGARQSFAWFKDGGPVRGGDELVLTSASPSDSGNYTCSLSNHPGTTSAVVRVDVEYGPKNTSANTPMVVDGGTSVSLICDSLANPPVQSYVWFRITDRVHEVGNQSVLRTGENGEYFCRATNKHGSQNSSVATVNIKGNWPYTIYIWIPLAVLLVVITIVVAVRFRKKTNSAQETKDREDNLSLMYVNCGGNQSAERDHEVETAETSAVIYSIVHFANGRGKQKEFNPDEVVYSTLSNI